MKLYKVNALAGAGKTYAATRYAHKLVRAGKKVLFIQPTMGLIDRTISGELSGLDSIKYRAIHSELATDGVVSEIVKHLKTTSAGGELLYITHKAFLDIPYFHRREDWTVIVDEIPSIEAHEVFNVPDTHGLITPYLRSAEYDDRYCLLQDEDTAGLRRIANNENDDDVWNMYRGLAYRVLSPDWRVYALDYQFQALCRGRGDKRQIQTYSLLKPSIFEGFERVIVMGACFDESVLAKYWTSEGVTFSDFRLPLRYEKHGRGDLIDIHYATPGNWSKVLRDREDKDGVSTLQKLILAAIDVTGGQPIAYMANVDQEGDLFGEIGTRLPNSPHGRNDFQHLQHVAVLSALNPTPAHFSFLGKRGISSDEIKDAGFRQTAYQAIMRGAIRDPSNTDRKSIIVPDLSTAQWLSGLFVGSQIHQLPGFWSGPTTRVKKHANDAARNKAFKDNKKREMISEINILNGLKCLSTRVPRFSNDTLIYKSSVAKSALISDDHIRLYGCIIPDIYSKDTYPVSHDDDDGFIADLRACHAHSCETKSGNVLFSPAVFNSELDPDTSRGLANIEYVAGIWLDNDGGDLTPDKFAELFPRLRVAIWNTFSSTPGKPKWRAYIPTTLAMPVSAHMAIGGAILDLLALEGYHSEQRGRGRPPKSPLRHGFDLSKITSSSLFYLPCQAAHGPDASFFHDYNDEIRGPLDPLAWAERCITYPDPDPLPVPVERRQAAPPAPVSPALQAIRDALEAASEAVSAHTRDARVEAAIQRWRDEGCIPGAGHAGFWRLGVSLAHSGLALDDIADHLRDEARYANSPRERTSEIKGILKKLARMIE